MALQAQTPQRPLPGMFLATPAPSRSMMPPAQPDFQRGGGGGPTSQSGSGSLGSQAPLAQQNQQQQQPPQQQQQNGQGQQRVQNQQGQSSNASPDAQTTARALSPIEKAARTINDTLQREANYPELDFYVKQGFSSNYDLSPRSRTGNSCWAPFKEVKVYAIPDQICEQFNQAAMSTQIGIFADINHAWIAVDNAFYMWDYTVPSPQPHGFEECKSKIIAVQLCVPRAGVFQESISHVIALADMNEMTLLAMGTSAGPNGGKTWTMFRTGMSVGIKGINVAQIASAMDSGRIFFSGNNLDVYELTYQNEEKWFAGRCGKINQTSSAYGQIVPMLWSQRQDEAVQQMVIDDTRRLLYTLSTQSNIRVYHLDSASTIRLVIEISRRRILESAGHLKSSPLLTNEMRITSISPISALESMRLHLMLTTNTGCRIYLSAMRGYSYSSSDHPPSTMQVQHIRFPPRSQASNNHGAQQDDGSTSNALMPAKHAARFAPGHFFCAVANRQTMSGEELFISAPDTGRILSEARAQSQPNFYESAAYLALPDQTTAIGLCTKYAAATRSPNGFGNELAVQFDGGHTEIAVLTVTGVHVFRRRRLVDVFATAVRSSGDEALHRDLQKFLEIYGRGETTATALAVACGQGMDDGEGRSRLTSPETLEAARKAFIEHGGRPTLDENAVGDDAASPIQRVRPSARHEAMALYIARLVRSLWKAPIVRETVSPGNGAISVTSTIGVGRLRTVQDELMRLRAFLQENRSFIDGLAGPEALQRAASAKEELALQGEHQAFQSLQVLNDSIIEGISFVQVLFEERLDQIWLELDPDTKQKLRRLTFEGLFASDEGHSLAKILVRAIVSRNITNGSNLDTVADALRRRCGSFCSHDDLIVFKAQEQLQKASLDGASSEHGRYLLNESLKLFEKVASSLTMENLKSAVEHFTRLEFYAGAIRLALLVATESDRGRLTESWYTAGASPSDPRAKKYHFRRDCYDMVHKILAEVDAASADQPDLMDGRPSIASLKRREAYAVVDDSNDEIFHQGLYDWYLQERGRERLLHIESRFIVPYLETIAAKDVNNADLLWKYHINHQDFFQAAEVQVQLAKSEEAPIPLAKRIEYLTRAKANASATTGISGRAQRQMTLHEISELLELANIQDELLQRLLADERIRDPAKRAQIVTDLDGKVRDLTMLFNDYADKVGYYDLCLLIYQAANYSDEGAIRSSWRSLINDAHERAAAGADASPYSSVANVLQDLCPRLKGSIQILSPSILIPMLMVYSIDYDAGEIPRDWVVDLCLAIGFPHDTIITQLQLLHGDEAPPFIGRFKLILVNAMVLTLRRWYEDCQRRNRRVFGGEAQAEEILVFLQSLVHTPGMGMQDLAAVNELCGRIEGHLR